MSLDAARRRGSQAAGKYALDPVIQQRALDHHAEAHFQGGSMDIDPTAGVGGGEARRGHRPAPGGASLAACCARPLHAPSSRVADALPDPRRGDVHVWRKRRRPLCDRRRAPTAAAAPPAARRHPPPPTALFLVPLGMYIDPLFDGGGAKQIS